MKKLKFLCIVLLLAATGTAAARAPKSLRKLNIGTSSGAFGPVDNWTAETFAKAVAEGVEYVEIGAGMLFLDKRDTTDALVEARCRKVKAAMDAAGMKVWSVHMVFGRTIDISETDEQVRSQTVELHKRVLRFCGIMKPKYILFHPSWFLRADERPQRIAQLVRSVNELRPDVKRSGATMVIENMLGYDLVRKENQEWPLNRTVEETCHIMSLLPRDVYAAVDTNHIDEPEKLISALGRRVKTVHISDGDGRNECHDMPQTGRGDNDWTAILRALDRDARYKGVFMYEANSRDFKAMKSCYDRLYDAASK